MEILTTQVLVVLFAHHGDSGSGVSLAISLKLMKLVLSSVHMSRGLEFDV
jgi:hypothetical protein